MVRLVFSRRRNKVLSKLVLGCVGLSNVANIPCEGILGEHALWLKTTCRLYLMGYQICERNNIILPLPVLNYRVSIEIILPDIFVL